MITKSNCFLRLLLFNINAPSTVREAWLQGFLSDQEMARLYNPLVGTKYEQMLKDPEINEWLTPESSDEEDASDEGETLDEEDCEVKTECMDEGECEYKPELEEEGEYQEEYEFEEGVLSDDEMSFGQSANLSTHFVDCTDLESQKLIGTASPEYDWGAFSSSDDISGPIGVDLFLNMEK